MWWAVGTGVDLSWPSEGRHDLVGTQHELGACEEGVSIAHDGMFLVVCAFVIGLDPQWCLVVRFIDANRDAVLESIRVCRGCFVSVCEISEAALCQTNMWQVLSGPLVWFRGTPFTPSLVSRNPTYTYFLRQLLHRAFLFGGDSFAFRNK